MTRGGGARRLGFVLVNLIVSWAKHGGFFALHGRRGTGDLYTALLGTRYANDVIYSSAAKRLRATWVAVGRVRSIGLRLFAPGPRVNTPAAGTTASRRLASVIANWPTLASLFAGWRLVFRLAALFVQRGTGCRRAGRRFRVGGSRKRRTCTLDLGWGFANICKYDFWQRIAACPRYARRSSVLWIFY